MSTLDRNEDAPQLISGIHCMRRKCGLELTFQSNCMRNLYTNVIKVTSKNVIQKLRVRGSLVRELQQLVNKASDMDNE
ncbi:unnamed protein product [Wuchereria bancrofti]|uniref:Uncharacterized protein n=1 Tax=Wuchereria bancrofti TaxID=6293 RepID=A0A3P7E1B2_WUCBA|nr:unnamed protein product [Wuchereria bancrofti]